MRKIIGIIFLISAVILFSCHNDPSQKMGRKKRSITIAGSSSVMPFSEKLAEHYMLGQRYYTVDIHSGGSTAGIQACINKTVQIGMSSRQLKEHEKILDEIPICYDGISIVVNPKNQIRNLSYIQIRDIFSGRIKNWKELGWIDREIDAVTREEGSGTRGSFEELVMKSEDIDDAIMVQDSNGSVKEVIATDPYAIGYISLGLVDKRVRALSIDGVTPSIKNIRKGRYKIKRPFIYLTNGEPVNGAKSFIDFVLSKDGQNILQKEGLVGARN